MGVILDSGIIIASECRGRTVRQILEQVRATQGEIEVGVSVVTIAEQVHGAYRAKTKEQQDRRNGLASRIRRCHVERARLPAATWPVNRATLAATALKREMAKGRPRAKHSQEKCWAAPLRWSL